MNRRVSITTLKRLERLEQSRAINRPKALFPPILDIASWEREAAQSQQKLMEETFNSAHPVPVDNLRDPMDVSHRYKPSATQFGTKVRH